MTVADAGRRTSAAAMLAAVAVIFVLRLAPIGRLVLYPLTLFATWVHEMGHGVTALLVGGQFHRLQIFADASGLASTAYPARGLGAALVPLGGLVAPPLVGCAILLLARSPRMGRVLLYLLMTTILVSLVVWVRTIVGAALLVPLVAALWLVTRRLSHGAGLFVVQLLGFALALDTVNRLDYLFVSSAVINGVSRPSDIGKIAEALGFPALWWGLLVAGFNLACVALCGYLALRRAAQLVPDAEGA